MLWTGVIAVEDGGTGLARPVVAVVGSLNADLVLPVAHLPRGGETVLTTAPGQQIFGGKGGNQAAAAAAFGAAVRMAGRVGDDEIGQRILADLAGRGVDVAGVLVTPGARSGLAAIAVDADGENLIIVDPGANLSLTAADVATAGLGGAAVVLVQLEIPLGAVAAAMRAAGGGRVVLNPAPAPATALPAEILELADVIVPNLTELGQLAGAGDPAGHGLMNDASIRESLMDASFIRSGPHAGLAEAAGLAAALPGVADIVVTLGKQGALVVPRSAGAGPVVHIPAPTVAAVDTTGAGDCFCGTLAVSLAEGLGLAESARWSVAAAAISTTAPGARGKLPARSEIAALAASLAIRQL